jgi:hypothetical protein
MQSLARHFAEILKLGELPAASEIRENRRDAILKIG